MTILNRDAFEVIEKIDDHPRVVIYCDPPYVVKAAKYEHDFLSADHARLAKALHRFRKTRVVVSYYRHPSLEALYRGWTVVDCAMNKGLHNAEVRGNVGKEALEILIINGPSWSGGKP